MILHMLANSACPRPAVKIDSGIVWGNIVLR
jgi:hypothetical protein